MRYNLSCRKNSNYAFFFRYAVQNIFMPPSSQDPETPWRRV